MAYDSFIDTLELFPRGLVYVALGIGILVIAKIVQEIATPYHVAEQLRTKDNVALAVSISGYYLGTIIIFVGALFQPGAGIIAEAGVIGNAGIIADTGIIADSGLGFTTDYWEDVLEVFLYSLAGIVVLNVLRILIDKLVLYQFNTEKEIIEDHNIGTGVVEAAVYIGVGLVIAGAIAGEGRASDSALTIAYQSLAFGGLGIATLIFYTLFYEFTTPFKIHEEIERDNVAVGVALAGNIIAISIITFKAVFGEFVSWTDSLVSFYTFAGLGFSVLFVVRLINDFVIFPRVKIADELAIDRNVGVAYIVSVMVISTSVILFFAI